MHDVFLTSQMGDFEYKLFFKDRDRCKHEDYIRICSGSEIFDMFDSTYLNIKNAVKKQDIIFYSEDLCKQEPLLNSQSSQLNLVFEYTIWDLLEVLLIMNARLMIGDQSVSSRQLTFDTENRCVLVGDKIIWALKTEATHSLRVECCDVDESFLNKFGGIHDISRTDCGISFYLFPEKCKHLWSYNYSMLRFTAAELEYIADKYLYLLMCNWGVELGVWYTSQVCGLKAYELQKQNNILNSDILHLSADVPDITVVQNAILTNKDAVGIIIRSRENPLAGLLSLVGKSGLYYTYLLKAFLSIVNADLLPDYEYSVCRDYYGNIGLYALQLFEYLQAIDSNSLLYMPSSIKLSEGSLLIERNI